MLLHFNILDCWSRKDFSRYNIFKIRVGIRYSLGPFSPSKYTPRNVISYSNTNKAPKFRTSSPLVRKWFPRSLSFECEVCTYVSNDVSCSKAVSFEFPKESSFLSDDCIFLQKDIQTNYSSFSLTSSTLLFDPLQKLKLFA